MSSGRAQREGVIQSGVQPASGQGFCSDYREWFSFEECLDFLQQPRYGRTRDGTRYQYSHPVSTAKQFQGARYVIMQHGIVLFSWGALS